MTTGLLWHPDCLAHDTGPAHPERPARLASVLERLEASGLAAEAATEPCPEAPYEALVAVHDPRHLAALEARCAEAPCHLDGDTNASPGTWHAALLAAGGALEAVERVREGAWDNAFVAVRPPGHHAERNRAMGFCLFNNVAVATAHLRRLGTERVAILDWDVHHGNGTQHLFERDPRVFYASLHQWPLYPGTGAAEERGVGEGEGTTLNCPLAAGSGDREWIGALEERVLPALGEFAPDFLLVSAGFDAHAADPLAGARVSEAGFAEMTRLVAAFAAERCGGRLVSVLEGGYDLEALSRSVEVHVAGLLGAGR